MPRNPAPPCRKRIGLSLALMAFVWVCCPARAAVQLAQLVCDHMVMQRGMPVPVWGWSDPGEEITVAIDQQVKTAKADATGKWLVHLDALETAAPRKMTVKGASGSLEVGDILVGEVWLGSGQSNMALGSAFFAKHDPGLEAIAAANHPRLRLFGSQGWQEGMPASQTNFSAQLLAFGVNLQQQLDVPVGLICRAVSGSASVPWLSEEAFQADPAIREQIAQYNKAHPQADAEALKQNAKDLAAWEQATAAGQNPGYKPLPRPLVSGTREFRGAFYERLIRPLMPFAIRGVLWDQGESGTGIAGVSNNGFIMTALVRSWRHDWGQGEFPFLYLQKSAGGCALNPDDPINRGATPFQPLPAVPPPWPNWPPPGPRLADIPNTFRVTDSDLDHSGSGHPANKSGYGARGCRVALGAVYGRSAEYYGPVYDSFAVEGGKIRVAFGHTGKGLVVPANQKLQGFAIAGQDKTFYWADAVIDGRTVVLCSSNVAGPVAVHYWSSGWANLFNRDGLPAVGFNTDAAR